MKVAVVGSRCLYINSLKPYIPADVTEIVSGGARGVDTAAKYFAKNSNLIYTEFLPEYDKYGRSAPLIRNDRIIARADMVVAIWDGKSRGTKYVIDKCREIGKTVKVYIVSSETMD